MKTMIRSVGLALALGALIGLAHAGSLTPPPGNPSSTMFSLQEIYDKFCTPTKVAATGQTLCWDDNGNVLPNCNGTGLDGQYRAGVSVGPRFKDNHDGTVLDNLTGLIWLKDANCAAIGSQIWINQFASAHSLNNGDCGLSDGSQEGDWRLPNVRELSSLTDFSVTGPALTPGHPFIHVANSFYWTSTSVVQSAQVSPSNAWKVDLNSAQVKWDIKNSTSLPAWFVKGGR